MKKLVLMGGRLGSWAVSPPCVTVARLVVGSVFLFSGIAKIQHPYAFLSNVYEYEVLGMTAAVGLATLLPWLELAIGVCLIGGVFVLGGSTFAVALLVVFTLAQISVASRGLTIGCGCFPTLSGSETTLDSIGIVSLTRNVLLLVCAIIVWHATRRRVFNLPARAARSLK